MRGPERLLIVLGAIVGLAFVFLYPPWSAGADEGTHFARALEMAHGRITPGEVDGRIASRIPTSIRDDQARVVQNIEGPAPLDGNLLGDLLDRRTDWEERFEVETQPTLVASPLAYAPSSVAMMAADRAGAPGVVLLWFGRVGNLAVYLVLALFAVRIATAFRWTLAIAALLPMNLGIAASVTPDALTIGSFLLVVAVWTRVWSPSESTEPPGSPRKASTRERLRAWSARPIGAATMVLGSGSLLVLTKPPYFVILAAFPALLVIRRRDRFVQAAAAAGLVSTGLGVLVALSTNSSSYKPVTVTLLGPIAYQPDVQQERLLSDPLGFLGRCVADWLGNLDTSVQRWVRHVGYWRTELPGWVSWVVIIGLVVAAMVLDRCDLLRLRRFTRLIFVVAPAAIIVVLYASSYIYFDDSPDGERMGLQIARYASPLFAVAVMGWAPRLLLRLPCRATLGRRAPHWVPVVAVVVLELIVIVAGMQTWLSTGRASTN